MSTPHTLVSPSLSRAAATPTSRELADWYFQQVREAETSTREAESRLTRFAWRVAGGSLVVALVAILGASGLVLLKRPNPPVILRDNTVTGVVDVLDVAKAGHVSWGEAEDRRDLRRYVEAREGYDWERIQDMYDLVKLMTDGKERDRYVGLYDQNKPDSPLALYKDRYRIIAKASTITFVGSTAQVFYSRKFIPLANAVEKPHTEYGVATIAYEHRDITKKESEREANPTGFTVLSYTPERDWTRATESGSAPGAAGIAAPVPTAATAASSMAVSAPAASSGGAR